MLGGLGAMVQGAGANLTATKIIKRYKVPSGTFDVKTYTSATPTANPMEEQSLNLVKGICDGLKDPNLEQNLKRNMESMPPPNQRFQTQSSLSESGDAGAGPDYVTEEDLQDHQEQTQKAKENMEDMPDAQNQMNDLFKAFGSMFDNNKYGYDESPHIRTCVVRNSSRCSSVWKER